MKDTIINCIIDKFVDEEHLGEEAIELNVKSFHVLKLKG
jgi:hypothetical protein